MQIESILAKNINGGGNANTDIARLKGARFVRTNEPSDGARFNEGLVKQMTGGDTIVARFLYGREFEFKANFKLWIACNSLIKIYGTDNGIWRRMRVIGFYKIFDENGNLIYDLEAMQGRKETLLVLNAIDSSVVNTSAGY